MLNHGLVNLLQHQEEHLHHADLEPSLPSLPEVVPLSLDVDVDVVMYAHEDMCPRPLCRGCCAPTIVSWRCRPEMPCTDVDIICEIFAGTP